MTINLKDYSKRRIEAKDELSELYAQMKENIFYLQCLDMLYCDYIPFKMDEEESEELKRQLLDNIIQQLKKNVNDFQGVVSKMSDAFKELIKSLNTLCEQSEDGTLRCFANDNENESKALDI